MPISYFNYKYCLKILVLFFFFGLSLYGISQQYITPIYSWYSESWGYRNPITISNSGDELSNQDILVVVDTATLISGSRLQSDCDDLRFIDSNDSTLLNYWIEGGCNTSSTQIWVRVPTVPSGGKTIYVYYGNSSATAGTQPWTGNLFLYADTTCPSGWTRASQFDSKFLYGSATYGSTGGTDSHSHGTASGTSDTLTGSAVTGLSGSTAGASSTHTHSNLQATVNTPSAILPSYLDMIVCYKNDFSIASGLISMFDATTPTGWTRFSALDSKFPRGASSYGGTGGSDTHNHTLTTGVTTGAASATQSALVPVSASGGTLTTSGDDTIRTFTSDGTLTVSQGGYVQVLAIGGGGKGGNDCGGGGGGGGFVYNSSYLLDAGSITVDIGGSRASTYFDDITANRGGDGGQLEYNGSAGGSGGGGGGWFNVSGTRTGGAGSQGGNGGNSSAYMGGAGGGGAGANGSSTSASRTGGAGGTGSLSSISGASVRYAGGGGGGAGSTPGAGGAGGGGAGGTGAGSAGTSGLGGGGGGGGSAAAGGAGGSGRLVVRYYSPAVSGTVASSSHTHTSSSGTISTDSNLPSYLSMVYAKANSQIYITEDNVLMTSVLPPYGWSRFTSLDSKFSRGSDTYGGTGGASTHTHDVTISTGAPSATTNYYGTTGNSFASNSHTHSVDVTSPSASSLPPYYTVINMQRKSSLETVLGSTEYFSNTPYAPTSLLTEGATNPTRVTDLTPEFSAVFSDPDISDTGNYYQIQVNTASDFTGTVMWDSGLQSITPITNGARSSDISYAGTALSQNGATYYWRIKFGDNYGFVSDWSSTAQFTMNTPPTAPTLLYTEGSSNPLKVTDTTPEFSAIFNDPNSGDTGIYYEIEVNTASDFSGTIMWDSGKTSITAITNGARSSDISYAGTALTTNGTQYYWKIRFWDSSDLISPWSSIANFIMDGAPTAPTELLLDGMTNPTVINSLTPTFSAIYNDPNSDTASAYEIEVNTSSSFSGTVMWDTGKLTTSINDNSRSPNYTYSGTELSGSSPTLYYWRIRFWDSDDLVGEWSITSYFTDMMTHLYLDGIQMDGLQID